MTKRLSIDRSKRNRKVRKINKVDCRANTSMLIKISWAWPAWYSSAIRGNSSGKIRKIPCPCLGIIATESLRRWAWYLKCKACRNSNYKLTISKPYLKLIYAVVRVLRCVTPCRRRERSTFGVSRGRLITPTMTSVAARAVPAFPRHRHVPSLPLPLFLPRR